MTLPKKQELLTAGQPRAKIHSIRVIRVPCYTYFRCVCPDDFLSADVDKYSLMAAPG
jgi:hypothetical protein